MNQTLHVRASHLALFLALILGFTMAGSVTIADRNAKSASKDVEKRVRTATKAVLQQRTGDLRAGCERGRKDRADNARGWQAAADVRAATAINPRVPRDERLAAANAAVEYGKIAASLRTRILPCEQAFPDRERPLEQGVTYRAIQRTTK